MRTDKKKLKKGLQRMAVTLVLMFTGPVVIHSAFKNQEHTMYYPVLVLGFLICTGAVAMGFSGIRTIMKALFND
ncbi:MAG: hypothetical protein KDD04_07705 [Sinomicrobium sp.]|nr:hypothetical protein [Sinomicrobium sp.]